MMKRIKAQKINVSYPFNIQEIDDAQLQQVNDIPAVIK